MDRFSLNQREFLGLADAMVRIGRRVAGYQPVIESRGKGVSADPITSWTIQPGYITKPDGSQVGGRDITLELDISREIERRIPYAIVAEEFGAYAPDDMYWDPEKSAYWCLDPLDGTSWGMKGFPEFCSISLGLIVNNQSVAGIVIQPFLEHAYIAIKGKGLFHKVPRWNRPGEYEWLLFEPTEKTRRIGLDLPIDFPNGKSLPEAYLREINILTHNFSKKKKFYAFPGVMGCIAVARGMCKYIVSHEWHMWDLAGAAPMIEARGGVIEDLYIGNPVDWNWFAINPKAPMGPLIVAESRETAAAVRRELNYHTYERPSDKILIT